MTTLDPATQAAASAIAASPNSASTADCLWNALAALAADEALQDTPVWEQVHNAYEAATGFCFSDVRDPRTYATPQGWRDGLVRDWDDAEEAGRLLEQGYRLTMERGHPDRAS